MGQSPACPAVSSRDPAPRPASTAARGPGAPSAPGPSQGVVVRLPLHALDVAPAGPARVGRGRARRRVSTDTRQSTSPAVQKGGRRVSFTPGSAPIPSRSAAMTPFPVHAGVGAHPEVTRRPPLSAPPTPPGRDGGAAGGSDRTQGVIDRVQTAVGVAAGQDPRGSRRAGPSATPLLVCYAPSPSAVREKGA